MLPHTASTVHPTPSGDRAIACRTSPDVRRRRQGYRPLACAQVRSFSAYTRSLTPAERGAALAAHYWPYRKAVEDAVAAAVDARQAVLHVSTHSFTPELRGKVRRCDVGFLYDPQRRGEVRFVEAWHAALRTAAPELVLRRNYPYSGVSDALVTHLRGRYGKRGYVGMELEVNQKHVGSDGWRKLVAVLAATLATAAG